MLRLTEATPIATRYSIEDAVFRAGPDYLFTGAGTYEISGQFAIKQTITLAGELKTAEGTRQVAFTNEPSAPVRQWPMLSARLVQTNGTLLSTITIDIAAAPLREIWFSTKVNFLGRAVVNGAEVTAEISTGDLISTAGRVVQRFEGDLDALDVLPGGELAVSTTANSMLDDGDFAMGNSGVIRHWEEFMPLVAPGLAADPGLDGLQLEGENKIYFSTKQDLGESAVRHGDILLVDTDAPTGGVFKTAADLLAKFHLSVAQDYGLDAFYIWPHGEIWFSISSDFSDTQLGKISQGELLSDAGYIVYRNADLIAPLRPVNETNNVGLDAVFVISDATAASGETRISATLDRANNSIVLNWNGPGRVFQVERAAEITGPWEALTPIAATTQWSDFGALNTRERRFHRLRQW